MNSKHRILLVGAMVAIVKAVVIVASVVTIASCTHVPRAIKHSDATESIRSQYLRDNPDGRFNNHIMKAELVREMKAVEVLASWGTPDQRRSTDHDSETWIYTARDDFSRDYISYSLMFHERVLTRWVVGRSTAAGHIRSPAGLDNSGTSQDPVLVSPRSSVFRTGGSQPRK